MGELGGDRGWAGGRLEARVAGAAFPGAARRQAHPASVADFEGGLVGGPAGSTADMEGTHRELGARFADRLGRDYSDRLAEIDQMPTAEIASVALDAYALARLAGEHRTNLGSRAAAIFSALDLVLLAPLVGEDQH